MPQYSNNDVMLQNLHDFQNDSGDTLSVSGTRNAADTMACESGAAVISSQQSISVNSLVGQTILRHSVRNLRDYVQNHQRHIQIEVNDVNGHALIRVMDSITNEVVRHIPSEGLFALSGCLPQAGRRLPKSL